MIKKEAYEKMIKWVEVHTGDEWEVEWRDTGRGFYTAMAISHDGMVTEILTIEYKE